MARAPRPTAPHLLALVLLIAGCASSPQTASDESTAQPEVTEKVEEPARFVVFSRLSPIYLAPTKDAPSVVYRTPEEQARRQEELAAERAKAAERLAERAERDGEREKKRAERVRKRLRRLRGDRREAYREKQDERLAKRDRQDAEAAMERELEWAREHPGEAPHEHLIVAELVEMRPGWVGFRPIPPRTPRCYAGAAPALSELDVTLWVERDELLRVVAERTRVPIARGTEVILSRGIALDSSGGKTRALIHGFELGLPIPDDAIDISYEAGRGFEAPYTETVFSPIAYRDALLRLEKDAALPFNPWFPLHVTATLYVGDKFYATTQTPCAEFTIRTVEEALEPVGQRATMRVGSSPTEEVSPPMIVAGAELFDPTGEALGASRATIPVIEEFEGPDGLECWHFEVWPDDGGSHRLPICAHEADFRSLSLTEGL